jgi:RNA polymerase sigma-70 factor (ECF subfamily)
MPRSAVGLDRSSDEALLAGMATGDDVATGELVRRYRRRVYGLALSIVADSGTAEEVAQEALVRVWRHAAVYDVRRGGVAAWVLTITRNLAIDAVRLRRATPIDPDAFGAMAGPADSPEGGEVAVDAVMAAARAPRVRAALGTLPPEQRRALVLAAVHGRTAREISELEQVPLGTAKTRIRTAMMKVRRELGEPDARTTGAGVPVAGVAGAAGVAGVVDRAREVPR